MVLEQIYSVSWLRKKPKYTFLLGITYSILGLFLAILIFPKNPGLASIAFTSLIILPSLNKLFELEENKEARKKLDLRLWNLFKEQIDVVKIYLFLFLGMLLTYAFFSMWFPPLANSAIFSQQINLIGEVGRATSWTSNLT